MLQSAQKSEAQLARTVLPPLVPAGQRRRASVATATQENGALRPQNGIYVLVIPADILQSTTTTSVLSKNTIAAWPKAA